jgi:hypothetical protein
MLPAFQKLASEFGMERLRELYRAPVFIISAPRSGSTLLFETLEVCHDFWSLGEESHSIFGALRQLRPMNNNFESGCLSAAQADPSTAALLQAGFLLFLRDSCQRRYLDLSPADQPAALRFLEKTPRNALNVPFLVKVFPDAKFIFLHRDPCRNISSIIEAWNTGLKDGSFVTITNLPGWDRRHWCMLLPPGWRDMNGKSIAEIATFQWRMCNQIALDDLQSLPRERWICIRHEDFIARPEAMVRQLCAFAAVRFDTPLAEKVSATLPLSKTTVSRPDPDKWRRHEAELKPLLPSLESLQARLAELTWTAPRPARALR